LGALNRDLRHRASELSGTRPDRVFVVRVQPDCVLKFFLAIR
jgi:hypothetical protein